MLLIWRSYVWEQLVCLRLLLPSPEDLGLGAVGHSFQEFFPEFFDLPVLFFICVWDLLLLIVVSLHLGDLVVQLHQLLRQRLLQLRLVPGRLLPIALLLQRRALLYEVQPKALLLCSMDHVINKYLLERRLLFLKAS